MLYKINKKMTELEKYLKVNKCESLRELSEVIKSFADENGIIKGRVHEFNAEKMADHCLNFEIFPPNVLTREYGIRQQAMYLLHYNLK